MRLCFEEESLDALCPLSFTGANSGFCSGSSCMGWQWEDLGELGGEAQRGFCGMVATPGKSRHQKSTPIY